MSGEITIENPTPEDDFIDDLVAQALERMESAGISGVQAFLKEHPEHSEILRSRLSALQQAGLVDEAGGPTKDGVPERLGEFRLGDRLGGGGMGVVYVAEQETLGRQVALKLVRPELLYFPGARERFTREVQAVARLSHPGIVPVYSVGEDRGIPWFAMELIRGATLAECIEDLAGRAPKDLRAEDLATAVEHVIAKRSAKAPGQDRAPSNSSGERTASSERDSSGAVARRSREPSSEQHARLFAGSWPAACARIVALVAEAVDHAHECGVTHRDLKPSNVLLTRSGRVLLFDFGLASAEGSHQITRSGVRLGSLAYMSPEQVDGDSANVDHRSDVYSLGVTLYELLTLKLPFSGTTSDAIAAAIRAGEPIPPRRRNPMVAEDLETVLLKALERDPARRYGTAKALAADLSNVLELRPIDARRPGPWLRAKRYVQRHPAVSVAIGLGLILVIGGPAMWFIQDRRADREIRSALDLANSNLQQSLLAVDQMLVRVGDKALRDVPQALTVRRALLDDANEFYGRFYANNPNDQQVGIRTLNGIVRLMFLEQEDGDWDRTETMAMRATAIADDLLAMYGEQADTLLLLGQASEALEITSRASGNVEAAREAAEKSLAVMRRAHALTGIDRVATVNLSSALNRRATAFATSGDVKSAERDLLEARNLMEQLVATMPDDFDVATRYTMALNNQGQLLMRLGRFEEALEPQTKAVSIMRVAFQSRPDSRDFLTALSACEGNLASTYGFLKQPERAIDALESTRERLDEYLVQFPDQLDAMRLLATVCDSLATQLAALKRAAESRDVGAKAIALHRSILARAPESPEFRLAALTSFTNGVIDARKRKDLDAAVALGNEGLGYATNLAFSTPIDRRIARYLHSQTGLAALDKGDHRRAVELARKLVEVLPDDAEAARIAGGLLARALGTIASDGKMSSFQRDDLLETITKESVALLLAAKAAGAVTNRDLESASDYEVLRSRPEYEALHAAPEVAKKNPSGS